MRGRPHTGFRAHAGHGPVAGQENDARITLLHVVESVPGETGARLYLAVPEIGPLRRELMDQARAELRQAVPDAARDFCR